MVVDGPASGLRKGCIVDAGKGVGKKSRTRLNPLFAAVTANDGFDPNVAGGPVYDAALLPNGQITVGSVTLENLAIASQGTP